MNRSQRIHELERRMDALDKMVGEVTGYLIETRERVIELGDNLVEARKILLETQAALIKDKVEKEKGTV